MNKGILTISTLILVTFLRTHATTAHKKGDWKLIMQTQNELVSAITQAHESYINKIYTNDYATLVEEHAAYERAIQAADAAFAKRISTLTGTELLPTMSINGASAVDFIAAHIALISRGVAGKENTVLNSDYAEKIHSILNWITDAYTASSTSNNKGGTTNE